MSFKTLCLLKLYVFYLLKNFMSLKKPLTSHILAKLNILFTTTNSFPIINFLFTVYWRLIKCCFILNFEQSNDYKK